MKTTEAKPGKPIVMKLRDDEEELVTKWLNLQDVYSDSIRYLIQKEIAENGLRNLQQYIPRVRSIESIRSQVAFEPQRSAITVNAPSHQIINNYQDQYERFNQSVGLETTIRIPDNSNKGSSIRNGDEEVTSSDDMKNPLSIGQRNPETSAPLSSLTTIVESKNNSPTLLEKEESDKNHELPQRRKAKKSFSADVMNSYT